MTLNNHLSCCRVLPMEVLSTECRQHETTRLGKAVISHETSLEEGMHPEGKAVREKDRPAVNIPSMACLVWLRVMQHHWEILVKQLPICGFCLSSNTRLQQPLPWVTWQEDLLVKDMRDLHPCLILHKLLSMDSTMESLTSCLLTKWETVWENEVDLETTLRVDPRKKDIRSLHKEMDSMNRENNTEASVRIIVTTTCHPSMTWMTALMMRRMTSRVTTAVEVPIPSLTLLSMVSPRHEKSVLYERLIRTETLVTSQVERN